MRATEIVDAETLSAGMQILTVGGKLWRVIGEPDELAGGDLVRLHLSFDGVERSLTVPRDRKYQVVLG